GPTELSGTMTVEEGGFELAGGLFTGRVDSAATVATTGSARFFWTNGGLGGVLHVAPAADVWIDGPAVKAFASAAVLNNAGRVACTERNLTHTADHVLHRATINNLSGGHFLADGALLLTSDYNPAFFHNHVGAVLEKTGVGTTTTSRWIVNN